MWLWSFIEAVAMYCTLNRAIDNGCSTAILASLADIPSYCADLSITH